MNLKDFIDSIQSLIEEFPELANYSLEDTNGNFLSSTKVKEGKIKLEFSKSSTKEIKTKPQLSVHEPSGRFKDLDDKDKILTILKNTYIIKSDVSYVLEFLPDFILYFNDQILSNSDQKEEMLSALVRSLEHVFGQCDLRLFESRKALYSVRHLAVSKEVEKALDKLVEKLTSTKEFLEIMMERVL